MAYALLGMCLGLFMAAAIRLVDEDESSESSEEYHYLARVRKTLTTTATVTYDVAYVHRADAIEHGLLMPYPHRPGRDERYRGHIHLDESNDLIPMDVDLPSILELRENNETGRFRITGDKDFNDGVAAEVCALVHHGYPGPSASSSGAAYKDDSITMHIARGIMIHGACAFRPTNKVVGITSNGLQDARMVVDMVSTIADDLTRGEPWHELRRRCECKKWILAGHSMGSAITFHAAAIIANHPKTHDGKLDLKLLGQIAVSPPFACNWDAVDWVYTNCMDTNWKGGAEDAGKDVRRLMIMGAIDNMRSDEHTYNHFLLDYLSNQWQDLKTHMVQITLPGVNHKWTGKLELLQETITNELNRVHDEWGSKSLLEDE